MPTYEYRCQACGHEFENFHSITAAPLRKCPSCGKLRLERLLGTGAGIIFKGSGFYTTDYRSDSYKKSAEADKKSATGGDSKSSPPDSKPSAGESKGSGGDSKPSGDAKPAEKSSEPQKPASDSTSKSKSKHRKTT
jgi:putative FmdB family regulatory protein